MASLGQSSASRRRRQDRTPRRRRLRIPEIPGRLHQPGSPAGSNLRAPAGSPNPRTLELPPKDLGDPWRILKRQKPLRPGFHPAHAQ